ncbi:MAG: exosortase H [Candidatus Zixiibacteriota bacterium]|nr:MAG: exosortase H [candidate division Zixibacteria bacterium]
MAKPSEGKPAPENKDASSEAGEMQSIRPVVRFVVLFLVLLVLISVGFSQLFTRYHDQLTWLMELTATITGATLSVFTGDVYYSGVHVAYKGFSVEIIDECTGLFEMLIYLAAVFSFSASVKKKLIGIAMGVPAIFIFNVARITALVVVGAYSWVTFNFMHLYLWQVTLILMISTVWVIWLYLVVYREKRAMAVSG